MPTSHPRPTSGQHMAMALRAAGSAHNGAAHLLRGCCLQDAAHQIDALAESAITELIQFRVQFRAELAELDSFVHITPAHFGGHHG